MDSAIIAVANFADEIIGQRFSRAQARNGKSGTVNTVNTALDVQGRLDALAGFIPVKLKVEQVPEPSPTGEQNNPNNPSNPTNPETVAQNLNPSTTKYRTILEGWNNTSVYLDSEFKLRLQDFLNDRVGGWQKNINFLDTYFLRRRWELSSDSPTSVTMKDMSPEDIQNLKKNANEAANKYGIKLKVDGSKVTFTFDKGNLKAQTEVVTFDGEEGLDRGYGLFKKGGWTGLGMGSDTVTITQGTLVALRDLAREMKGIGDASSVDRFKFDEIKLLQIDSVDHTKVGIEDANGVYKTIFDANPQLAQKYGFTIDEGQKNGKRMYILTYKGK